jgi:hypothetical protein
MSHGSIREYAAALRPLYLTYAHPILVGMERNWRRGRPLLPGLFEAVRQPGRHALGPPPEPEQLPRATASSDRQGWVRAEDRRCKEER